MYICHQALSVQMPVGIRNLMHWVLYIANIIIKEKTYALPHLMTSPQNRY